MNIGILGTGIVGTTIGSKLVERGHEVMLGSRTADNAKATAWAERMAMAAQNTPSDGAKRAKHGTFADAAAFGDMLFLCTTGSAALEVLRLAKADNIGGKILVDITNPLSFSVKSTPTLYISGGVNSLAEQIQKAVPAARVVKTLNTVTADVMVNPSLLAGDHDMFIAGDDEHAKAQVKTLLHEEFGWKTVHDVGDLSGARAMEGYLLLWLRLWGTLGTPNFNLKILR
jgi:hypothetical protein